MIGKLWGIVCLAATVAAAALVLAAPAGARTDRAVHVVSGTDLDGVVSGSLEGRFADTDETFPSFFRTRRLTPGGILTWRAPVDFVGCIDGDHCGTLHLEGHHVYRFKPGTTYYDFDLGGYQPGTVGDPAAWISGRTVLRVTGACWEPETPQEECVPAEASGLLVFTETAFLSAHTYRGVVLL